MKHRDAMTPKLNDAAEERLRPSRFLGYDRDRIGVFLLSKELYEVAESQFRRAHYLNPYDGAFPRHLAWALFKQGRYEEAKEWIDESMRLTERDPDSHYIAGRISDALKGMEEGKGDVP